MYNSHGTSPQNVFNFDDWVLSANISSYELAYSWMLLNLPKALLHQGVRLHTGSKEYFEVLGSSSNR
jgi:hypothetical protein